MIEVYKIAAKKNAENICKGFTIDDTKLDEYLKDQIRKIIFDKQGTEELIAELRSTDFSETQLKEVFSLESQEELLKNFRIGEALVETLLSEHFSVLFYWNSVRDEANPHGNRTGVDIIGFQKRNGKLNFVFVEVKTSYDADAPPSVIYSLTKQLEELATYNHIPKNAIRCLGFKAKTAGFITEFKEALSEFVTKRYVVAGGLVRDTSPNQLDIKQRFLKLDKDTPAEIHVQMYTFYFMKKIEKWPGVVLEGGKEDAE